MKTRIITTIGLSFLILIGSFAWYKYTQADITTSLADWWKFDEGSGATSADNGSNNDGSYYQHLNGGYTWVAGKVGNAVDYNGSTGFAEENNVSLQITGATNFTVSYWIKPDDVSTLTAHVYQFDPNAGSGFITGNDLTVAQTSVYCGFTNSGADWGETASGAIANGVWAQVTCVYDGSQSGNANRLKIYINGVNQSLSFTGTIPASMNGGTQPITVGAYDNLGTISRFEAGTIDEVRVYNRSLTQADVTELYNYPPSASASLNKFTIASGRTLKVASGRTLIIK